MNGRPVTVRTANGELTGIAKIDIDVVTGMVRYSGIPVSFAPGMMPPRTEIAPVA